MRTLICLTFLMSLQVFAEAPECPLYASQYDCLWTVDKNFDQILDYIKEEYFEGEGQGELIEAAKDVKHYEKLACLKTCLN